MENRFLDRLTQRRILLALIIIFSALVIDLHEPDSMIDRIEEQDRTTNLMTGEVFIVHFESGGKDRFSYVSHREDTYCSVNPNSSECPPEEHPEKPPLMEKFNFTKKPTKDTVYVPESAICIDGTYERCSGKSRLEPALENLAFSILGSEEVFSIL